MADNLQRTKGAALAIVITAVVLLLLRPLCGLAFSPAVQGDMAPAAVMAGHGAAGHADTGTPESVPCCASVSDGTLVNPAVLLSPGLPDAPLGAALFLLAGLPLFAMSQHSVRFRLTAPPERPFYARSARILR